MKHRHTLLLLLPLCASLLSCGNQADTANDTPSLLPDAAPAINVQTTANIVNVTKPEVPTTANTSTPTPSAAPTPTATSSPTPTLPPGVTPLPSPTPITPIPSPPPLEMELVDDSLPWDTKALPETDRVLIVKFIQTDWDDLLVAYAVSVDMHWDENDFIDEKNRPKLIHTLWLRDDTYCFMYSTEMNSIGFYPEENIEPGIYNVSHDIFRWETKWYDHIWWCGIKDGEIVYLRQHHEG